MAVGDSYFKLKENKTLKRLFLVLFGAVGICLILIFRYYFWPFLGALILYLALKPVYDSVQRKVRSRSFSSLIVIILLILLVLVPMIYLLTILTDQAYQFYTIVEKKIQSDYFSKLEESPMLSVIADRLHIDKSDIILKLNEFLQSAAVKIVNSVTIVISYPISFITNFFFMVLILFFLFKDGNLLSPMFYRVLPFPDDLERRVVERLKEVIKILLAGNLIIMFFQGIMVGISLYIVGIGMPLLWGSIAAIMSLIPIVGTTFIWFPVVLFLFFQESYLSAIFVGVWCLFWYLFLENLVKPKVFGKKLRFHPVVLFFLLLGSIHALYLPGIIIGPILLTLFYSLWEIYKILEGIDTVPDGEK